MNNKNPEKNKKRLFPIYVYVLWGLLALSIVVYILCRVSVSFADFYNQYPGAFVRAILAYMTNLLPISLAEICIILAPAAVVFIGVYAYRHRKKEMFSAVRFFICIITCASYFLSIFVVGYGCGYHGSTLDVKMGLTKKDVAPKELEDTAEWLATEVAGLTDSIEFEEESFSKMPYSFSEMNNKLLDAYDKVCEEYDFIQKLYSRVKPVMLSEAMSYTHITGVYTYFTGEANVNVDFPDYTIPFTTAHELAHQRGIAREDEANFVAFLVCINSDDPYIRYSGYLNMFDYVSPKLRAQKEEYKRVYAILPIEVQYERYAYSEFFKKYQDSVAGQVSESVNNGYLQMQGTVGTKSYGMVVDLTVAYYKSENKK